MTVLTSIMHACALPLLAVCVIDDTTAAYVLRFLNTYILQRKVMILLLILIVTILYSALVVHDHILLEVALNQKSYIIKASKPKTFSRPFVIRTQTIRATKDATGECDLIVRLTMDRCIPVVNVYLEAARGSHPMAPACRPAPSVHFYITFRTHSRSEQPARAAFVYVSRDAGIGVFIAKITPP